MLVLLFIWSAGWIVYASIKLRIDYKDKSSNYYFDLTNILWCLINIAIALGGVIFLNTVYDRTDLEPTLNVLTNIVVVNFFLDWIYIFVAVILLRSRSKYKKILNGIGRSIFIQGLFLLIFDLILTIFLILS